MEEKEGIKVRLSTVIYLIIIVMLIFALGITYYFGFVANKDEKLSNENVANLNNNSISNIDSNVKNNTKESTDGENNVINNDSTNNIELNMGTFTVTGFTEDDENILGYIHISNDKTFTMPRTRRNV